jgi:hypothetical protein
MKKLFWISVFIAILAAFFASTYPDGLDFVAEKFGFAAKGMGQSAPLSGYSLPFLPAGVGSTAAAGVAGVLITLGVFCLAVRTIKFTTK